MGRQAAAVWLTMFGLVVLLLAGCGGDDGGTGPVGDTTAPAKVTDLSVASTTDSSATLTWTAPGDDGDGGRASEYDVRYSTLVDTLADWWDSLTVAVQSLPSPQAAGSAESLSVEGLMPDTTYYFAMKAGDEVPNWSDLSNVASGTALPDTTPPRAVTSLSVTSTTESSATLSWIAPGGKDEERIAAEYDIRYSLSVITELNWGSATQAEGEPDPEPAGSFEDFTVTGLLPDTTYYFAMKTADQAGNWSGLSNVASDATLPDTTPAAAVTNLSVTSTTDSSATLTWTAPEGKGDVRTAAEYDIRYSLSVITELNWGSATQAEGEPAPEAPGSLEEFTVTGLLADTTYHFALKTADQVGNWSDLSNVASDGTLPDVTPPAAVADLSVASTTDSSATLTWTAPEGKEEERIAAEYDIRYSTSAITEGNWGSATQAEGEPDPQAPGSLEDFTVTGLLANTTYYLALKTADEAGNWSALSNVASDATLPDVTPPAAVADLSVASTTDSSATLTWTAPGGKDEERIAAEYDIRYSTSAITEGNWASATQAEGEPDPEAPGSLEDLTVTGLLADMTYHFAMKTADQAGNWSSLSNVASDATLPDVTPPAAIEDLSVTATTSSSVTLSWTAPGDDGILRTAAEYDIRYSITTITEENWTYAIQVDGEPVPQTAGSTEAFEVTGLFAGTTYYLALKTADEAANWSELSNVASGKTWPEDMVLIPAGAFTMGSDPGEGSTNQEPEHQPYISAFYIDLYEVTNAQYVEALIWAEANGYAYWDGSDVVESSGDNTLYVEVSDAGCRIDRSGSSFVIEAGYEDHPVVDVSWYGSAAYCNWRSMMEILTPCYDTQTWSCDFTPGSYRLPTEAEWEKAARGSSDERTYPWGDEAPTCGTVNWSGCAGGTTPVGSYELGRSPYGLYDMSGNAWEWSNDWYSSTYYSTSPGSDPRGPSSGTTRVIRGGSWGSYTEGNMSCTVRNNPSPGGANHSLGFRCVTGE